MSTDQEHAEQSIIGSVLLTDGKLLQDLTITAAEFGSLRCEEAFRLMQQLWAKGRPVNLVTMGDAVSKSPDNIKRLVELPWLHDTMSGTPTSASALEYERIVKDQASRRRIRSAISQIASSIDTAENVNDVIDQARSLIDSAATIDAFALRPMSETVKDTIARMKEPPRFTPTPWADLNHLISGWRPGALYVIGARPGTGKTVIGVQAGVNLLKTGTVIMCTLEMTQDEIHKRVISQQLNIPLGNLLDNTMTREEWATIENDHPRTWERYYVDDNPMQTVEAIRRNARSISRRQPLSGIVVDYLQLMESKATGGKKRHELIAEWTRQLKIMAKEFDVPVIILSQLNRESARGAAPTLADLRESGAIEQDADVVMLLDRDEMQGMLRMNVAKNRHGMRHDFALRFEGKYARAVNDTFKGIAA